MSEKTKETEIQLEREIALDIIRDHYISTIIETDELCIYDDGIYKKGIGVFNIIKSFIKDVSDLKEVGSGDNIKPYRLSMARQGMIIDFIRSLTYCKMDDFDDDERVINLKNGLYFLDGFERLIPKVYNTKTDELEFIRVNFITHMDYINMKKSPYKAFIQIPVNYKEGVICWDIENVFKSVFTDSLDLIYEMIGYFMIPSTKYGKAFMFYGQTGTGKTTAINIIISFIGHENTSGVELQDLDIKFELEKTRNKLLNIFDDLSSKPISFVGNFKKLVTNMYLYGRIKHIQDEARWKNKCKGLFATNVLMKIKEYVTDAFYKRWVLEPCFVDFKELGTMDTNLRDKVYDDDEMSGLFNRALGGLRRLEERGNFPDEWQDIDFVKNYWLMDINPVNKFVDECCVLGKEFDIDYGILYKALCEFRAGHRVKEISKSMMTRALKKLNDKLEVKKVSKKSPYLHLYPSERKFVGIKLNDDYNIGLDEVHKPLTLMEHLKK